jgi:glycosyltransferase involved in cell wall biosynthesis
LPLCLARKAREAAVVQVFGCSWLYFFLTAAPAVLVGRLLGCRVVLTYHGGEAEDFLRTWAPLARPVFRAAHCVSAPSAFLAGIIGRRAGVSVFIVPNIVDTSMFRFRLRAAVAPKMVVTRHLSALYGIDTVLRAFHTVQQSWPEARLWIAGTGEEESRLRALVSEWNLRNVSFLGFVDAARLPALYDECDILLNGSRADNFPLSLIEASAAGLVVISTNAGGIPFVYEHGRNALLADIGDGDAMAAAVAAVLRDPALAQRLTLAGRRVAAACEWRNVRTSAMETYGGAFRPSGVLCG